MQYLSPISAVHGALQAIGSLPISWKSHPSEVLPEPFSLLEPVTGRKYHYPHTFHCLSEKLFRILKLHILSLVHLESWRMVSVADDFLTARVINVPVKLLFNFQVTFERVFLLLSPLWTERRLLRGVFTKIFSIFFLHPLWTPLPTCRKRPQMRQFPEKSCP